MRGLISKLILIWIVAATSSLCTAQSQAVHSSSSGGFGPEVKAFLELMRQEETELEFQIQHNEISRKDYNRSRSRIAVLRQTVLNIVRKTGEDEVPEIHVVVSEEVDQIVESGVKALKGIKPGAVIEGSWRYLGTASRGETFFIFERLPGK